MKVSHIASMQWKQFCQLSSGKAINNRERQYKIIRAATLGKRTYRYPDGSIIYRYFNLNVLVSKKGLVMVVWLDLKTPPHEVSRERKFMFDKRFKEKFMEGSKPTGETTKKKQIV